MDLGKFWKDCSKSLKIEGSNLDCLEQLIEKKGWRVVATFVQSELNADGNIRKYWTSYGYVKHESSLERAITNEQEYSNKIEATKGMIYEMWQLGYS